MEEEQLKITYRQRRHEFDFYITQQGPERLRYNNSAGKSNFETKLTHYIVLFSLQSLVYSNIVTAHLVFFR